MTTLAQAARIEKRIRRHWMLSQHYAAKGMTREEASKAAYRQICDELTAKGKNK